MLITICYTIINRSLLQESRLLNFSSGLEQRFYPQWSVRVLNLPSLAKGETYQTTDPIEQTVNRIAVYHNELYLNTGII